MPRKKTNGIHGTNRPAIADAVLAPKGRKALIVTHHLDLLDRVRSPLTSQLFSTLHQRDSYVRIPLTKSRTKHQVKFNLEQKAKRIGATLRWVVEGSEFCAWLEPRKEAPRGEEASSAV